MGCCQLKVVEADQYQWGVALRGALAMSSEKHYVFFNMKGDLACKQLGQPWPEPGMAHKTF